MESATSQVFLSVSKAEPYNQGAQRLFPPPLQWISPHGCKIWILKSCQKKLQNAYHTRNFILNNFVLHD